MHLGGPASRKGSGVNVLISSAGRRTSLVEAFRRAVEPGGGLVIAADIDPLAPALYAANVAIPIPPISSDEFLPSLLEAAVGNDVALVIPTIDTELGPLASGAGRFADEGVRALISSEELVASTGDKVVAAGFFARLGIATPETWLPAELPDRPPERLFVKPRRGSASSHCYPVERDRLDSILELVPDPVIQGHLPGSEITIDVLFDFGGEPLHYVPRRRIRTLGGESIQGETLPPAPYSSWIVDVLHKLGAEGAVGPITLQAFDTVDGLILTEVNPRFGGGVPLAFAAGGDYPTWLLNLAEGKAVEPRLGDYRVGLRMTRSMREFFVEEPLWS